MTFRNLLRFVLLMTVILPAAGCSRKSVLEPWPLSTDPVVYSGGFGDHVIWEAFGNSNLTALALDPANPHTRGSSLKFTVGATGLYAGGALTTKRLRNLSGYNAVSFWAKASRAVVFETAGFGNDNTGRSKYTAQRANLSLTTDWQQFYIVVPNPARLTAEGGMFFLSEGIKAGGAFTFWIDDIQFVNLVGAISNTRPALTPATVDGIVGSTLSLQGSTKSVFAVYGLDQTVTHMPGYFDYASTDSNVAMPIAGGIQVVGGGTATVTARLAGVNATGTVTVNATEPPATAAPTPTLPAANVISFFSGPYTNVAVDNWNPNWGQSSMPIYAEVNIAGNPTKRYTNLAPTWAGIDFSTHVFDATAMTAFHMDVWAPSGTMFRVKLVDFGANGVYGATGGNPNDDTSCELTYDGSTTPAFTTGTWVPLEIPLANFTTLTSRAHLAQIVISSSDTKIVYVDNIYLHN